MRNCYELCSLIAWNKLYLITRSSANVRKYFVYELIKSFLLKIDWLLCSVCDTVQLVPTRFDGWVMVTTLDTTVSERRKVSLRFWGPRLKLSSDSWSNSLIVGINLPASAKKNVLMSPSNKIKIYRNYCVIIFTCHVIFCWYICEIPGYISKGLCF